MSDGKSTVLPVVNNTEESCAAKQESKGGRVMDASKRAELIVTTEPGIDAIRHGDTFLLESLITSVIRAAEDAATQAERERCAWLAHRLWSKWSYVANVDCPLLTGDMKLELAELEDAIRQGKQ